MQVRTDDEVYRVDAVWLGPPKATFPWRARYVAWGVGILIFLLVLAAERRMNIGFGFFSTAWAMVITIALTRLICSRISHERPLSAVLVMWLRELTAPRGSSKGRGGAASAAALRVSARRPRPAARSKRSKRSERTKRSGTASGAARSGPTSPTRQSAGPGPGQEARKPRDSARSGATGRGRTLNRRVRSKEVRGVRSRARS
ncbi:hypothetical protein CDG81_06645 [Actinopolyspora erythraea]|uniref:DUF3043 domain-containing protein n=1 Tax=Actinopolyspora erythraea TaxID=414996 RepID=A0A099D384_9ACTN|nr:hypothetical protein [Actinopolyspora erythraea]ASU78040.1 hypothetical protein CDG81_06645 [Actinopolyspora erythraea]KGI79805.1 hypothetical protein IL38_21675 [Actinopolyspora erythraea]